LRFALFKDITKRIVVFPCRSFGTRCWYNLQLSRNQRRKSIERTRRTPCL